MFENVRANLQKFISPSAQELDLFCSKLTTKKLKRREFLYEEGQICKSVAFINKGCLRYFYLTGGEEQTGQFFFENAWYIDYESFLSGKPTQQYIQALEPAELFLLPKTALYQRHQSLQAPIRHRHVADGWFGLEFSLQKNSVEH